MSTVRMACCCGAELAQGIASKLCAVLGADSQLTDLPCKPDAPSVQPSKREAAALTAAAERSTR